MPLVLVIATVGGLDTASFSKNGFLNNRYYYYY